MAFGILGSPKNGFRLSGPQIQQALNFRNSRAESLRALNSALRGRGHFPRSLFSAEKLRRGAVKPGQGEHHPCLGRFNFGQIYSESLRVQTTRAILGIREISMGIIRRAFRLLALARVFAANILTPSPMKNRHKITIL